MVVSNVPGTPGLSNPGFEKCAAVGRTVSGV